MTRSVFMTIAANRVWSAPALPPRGNRPAPSRHLPGPGTVRSRSLLLSRFGWCPCHDAAYLPSYLLPPPVVLVHRSPHRAACELTPDNDPCAPVATRHGDAGRLV